MSQELNEALKEAILDNDLKQVIAYHEKGAEINAPDSIGMTPLHWAFAHKRMNNNQGKFDLTKTDSRTQLDIIAYLQKQGANFKAKNISGQTPLEMCFENSQQPILKYNLTIDDIQKGKEYEPNIPLKNILNSFLLDNKLLTNDELAELIDTHNLSTPLHVLISKGDLESIKRLVAMGYNIDSKDSYGLTPLEYAAKKEQVQIVQYLIEQDAKVNSATLKDKKKATSTTALHEAARRGNLPIVKILLESGADLHATDNHVHRKSVLNAALRSGNLDVIKFIVNNGAEITEKDYNYAVKNSNPEIIAFLKAQPRILKPKLLKAVKKGNVKKVTRYLELAKKQNIDMAFLNDTDKYDFYNTSLHLAARTGNTEIIQLLVDYGVNVNAINILNETPLHIAALFTKIEAFIYLNNNSNIVDFLDIENQKASDIIIKNIKQDLREAIKESDKTQVEQTLESAKKLNININLLNTIDIYGYTFLHKAIEVGNADIIQLMIDYGADLNPKDAIEPPLHTAAFYGNQKVIQCLEDNIKKYPPEKMNSIIEARDYEGKTANCYRGYKGTLLPPPKPRKLSDNNTNIAHNNPENTSGNNIRSHSFSQ